MSRNATLWLLAFAFVGGFAIRVLGETLARGASEERPRANAALSDWGGREPQEARRAPSRGPSEPAGEQVEARHSTVDPAPSADLGARVAGEPPLPETSAANVAPRTPAWMPSMSVSLERREPGTSSNLSARSRGTTASSTDLGPS